MSWAARHQLTLTNTIAFDMLPSSKHLRRRDGSQRLCSLAWSALPPPLLEGGWQMRNDKGQEPPQKKFQQLTSGAIQYGVPTTCCCSSSPCSSNSPSLVATPKSASFTTPCRATRGSGGQSTRFNSLHNACWVAGHDTRTDKELKEHHRYFCNDA